jgi:hypothetical protein
MLFVANSLGTTNLRIHIEIVSFELFSQSCIYVFDSNIFKEEFFLEELLDEYMRNKWKDGVIKGFMKPGLASKLHLFDWVIGFCNFLFCILYFPNDRFMCFLIF